MKWKPQTTVWLSIAIVAVGIGITMATGLWQTESNKIPRALPTPAVVAVSESGESTTVQYDPADIRGSYKFGEVSNLYGIPLEVLAQAFGIPQSDVEAFQVKGLEALYPDTENEIGTASVRLFTAGYLGLTYTPGEDTWLPASAAAILTQRAVMNGDLAAYVATHTLP